MYVDTQEMGLCGYSSVGKVGHGGVSAEAYCSHLWKMERRYNTSGPGYQQALVVRNYHAVQEHPWPRCSDSDQSDDDQTHVHSEKQRKWPHDNAIYKETNKELSSTVVWSIEVALSSQTESNLLHSSLRP